MAEIFCKLQENLIDYKFSNSQQEEILAFAANQNENQSNELNEGLISTASKILHNTNPWEKRTNQKVIESFLKYFFGLPIGEQCDLYKGRGYWPGLCPGP